VKKESCFSFPGLICILLNKKKKGKDPAGTEGEEPGKRKEKMKNEGK